MRKRARVAADGAHIVLLTDGAEAAIRRAAAEVLRHRNHLAETLAESPAFETAFFNCFSHLFQSECPMIFERVMLQMLLCSLT